MTSHWVRTEARHEGTCSEWLAPGTAQTCTSAATGVRVGPPSQWGSSVPPTTRPGAGYVSMARLTRASSSRGVSYTPATS